LWFTSDCDRTEEGFVSIDPFYPVRIMFSSQVYDDIIATDKHILHLFRDKTNNAYRSESCFSINAAILLPSLQAILHKYGINDAVMDDVRFSKRAGSVAGYKNSYKNLNSDDMSSLVVMMKTIACGSSIIEYMSKNDSILKEVYEHCLNLLRKSVFDSDYKSAGTDDTPVVRRMCTYVTTRYNYEIMNLLMVGAGAYHRQYVPTGVSGINSHMIIPVVNAVDRFLSKEGADFRGIDPFIFVDDACNLLDVKKLEERFTTKQRFNKDLC
jgi:hypothetical protein